MENRIEHYRLQRGVSRDALAAAIGVSALAIEQYEQFKWRPGLDVLVKMADYFGTTVADIVGDCHIVTDDATNSQIILRNTNGCSIKVVGKLEGKNGKSA